ncbi:MAG: DUF58 domain-containing protein [Anaerolineaceae bacterium]|nr:DUF58 domain-containing protein [Anaerolineaceae bacterium]
MSLPFLVYIGIAVLQSPNKVNIKVTHTLEHSSTTAQTPVEITVSIVNAGDSIENLLVCDLPHSSTTILQGQAQQRVCLPAGGQFEWRYTLQAGRGDYPWESIKAIASDPFSLFEMEQAIAIHSELIVRPEVTKLRHLPLRPRNTLHSPGSIPARLAGSGTDFWGIREYHPGDPLQRLNWRKTARQPQKLYTKEFEQEEIADIGLILDARIPADLPSVAGNSFFDHAVCATASLAEIFLREGNRVGLLVFGQKMIHLFPGYGKHQLNKILTDLAGASASPHFSLSYLEYLPIRMFPGRSQIVMISPVGANDLAAYTRMRSMGYQILLVSPNPVEYFAQAAKMDTLNALSIRAARLERNLQLQQLLRLGVRVVDWPVNRSLNEIIHSSLIK